MYSLISVFAVATVLPTGCGSSEATATPPVAATGGMTVALAGQCEKLDQVYRTDFAPYAAKADPAAKQIVDKLLEGKGDVKSLVAKNKPIFEDAIKQVQPMLTHLSTSTSADVAVSDHDAYAAFYTGVSQKVTSRKDEYTAILKLEKGTAKTDVQAVLDDAKLVTGMDLAYNQAKP
jgi:hypothetical protein